VVRKLEHVLADQAKRDADDRVVVSRTEEHREEQRVEAERFELAKKLTQLKDSQLERLGLPDHYLTIIAEIRVISSIPARHRAIKRLRAELRDIDFEALARSLAALTDPQAPRQADAATLWGERLMGGNDAALTEFLERYPVADRAQLRTLLRNRLRAKQPEQKRAQNRLLQAIRLAMRSPTNAALEPRDDNGAADSES
jgi:ribosome-associated protein